MQEDDILLQDPANVDLILLTYSLVWSTPENRTRSRRDSFETRLTKALIYSDNVPIKDRIKGMCALKEMIIERTRENFMEAGEKTWRKIFGVFILLLCIFIALLVRLEWS
jgi:Flp pilus assembly protein TadB